MMVSFIEVYQKALQLDPVDRARLIEYLSVPPVSLAHFDQMASQIAAKNEAFSDAEVAADVATAISETRQQT